MDFKQRSTIVNTYFKYTGIFLLLAMLIPIFVNLNGDETSFTSWMKFFFVSFLFMAFTMLINAFILRGVVMS